MTTRITVAALGLLSLAGFTLHAAPASAHASLEAGQATANETGGGHNHGAMQMAQHDGVSVEAPFARASAGPARNGAAYLTLKNAGGHADRLIGASTPAAERAELHTHIKDGDIMKMRQIEAVDVPAGGMAMLEPGGDHVMLMGLKAPLKEGESFPLTLIFENAGEVTVDVAIGAVGAMEGHGGMSHHGTHGGGHDMKKKSN